MSAVVPAVEVAPSRPVAVRFDRLLALYVLVPIVLLAVLLDLTVLHGSIRRALPRHPDQIAFFTIFFNLPHVLASHLIFLDGEYVPHYKRHLLGFGAILLLVTVILYNTVPILLLVFSLLFTFFHIITQQVGLTGAQLRRSDRTFMAWKWLAILIGIGGYTFSLDARFPGAVVRGWFVMLCCVLVLPAIYFAIRLHRDAPNAGARRYLWANMLLLPGMLVLGFLRYPFFVVLLPRIVHDLTAFYVYGVHDHNRSQQEHKNVLFRMGAAIGLPTWVVGPVVAIVLAFVVEKVLSPRDSLTVIYVVSAFHYYLEGVVWKRGTLHRKYVAFV